MRRARDGVGGACEQCSPCWEFIAGVSVVLSWTVIFSKLILVIYTKTENRKHEILDFNFILAFFFLFFFYNSRFVLIVYIITFKFKIFNLKFTILSFIITILTFKITIFTITFFFLLLNSRLL